MQCWCSVSLQRAAGCNVIRDLWLALSLNTKPEAFAQPQQTLVQRSETISTGRVENRYKTGAAEPDKGSAKQNSCFGPLLMQCSGRAH